MPKKPKDTEPKDVDEDLEDDEDEEDGYALGSDKGPLGERDLVQVLSQFDWAGGQYYIDVYRDRPFEWKGKDCHGYIDRVHRPVDIAWLEKFHGGKTYHFLIRGPHPKTGHEGVIVGRINGIIVAGEPKLGGRSAREAIEGEEEGGGAPPTASGAGNTWDPIANKLVDATIDETKMLRRHALRGQDKPSELSVIMQQQQKSMELAQKRADAEAARQNTLMIELMRGRQDVGDPGESYRGIVDQMRRDMDTARAEHSRELRELAERHAQAVRDLEQRNREQVERMRDDAGSERDRLRDEADKREQRMRDEWGTREQSIRDTWDGRLAALKDNADAREKALQDIITEQRERLRDFDGKLTGLTTERDGARLEAVRLESVLSTKQDPKPPLESLQEVLTIGNEVARLTGQAPTPDSPMDQAMKVLQSEPAQRVAAGLQGFLSNMANRGAMAPPAAGVEQWQQHVQGQTALPAPQPMANPAQPRVVRRRRRVVPDGEMEMPEYSGGVEAEVVPETPVPPPVPPPVPAPTPTGEPDPRVILALIEDSAGVEKPVDQFLSELGAVVGGMPVLSQVAVLDFDILVGGIEENSGEQLTFAGKQYIREAIPRLRELLAQQAAQA
jgi:hypothetical protein